MNFYKQLIFSALAGIALLGIISGCEEDPTTIGDGVVSGEPFTTNKAIYDVFAFNRKINAVQTNNLPVYQLGTFNDPIYGKTEASITTQLRLTSSKPTFGLFPQETEDNAETDDSDSTIEEEETVTSVFLNIPYLTKSNPDTDGDGVIDELDKDIEDPNNDNDGDGLTNNEERILGSDPLDADTDQDNDDTPDNLDSDFVANIYEKRFDLDSIYGSRTEPFNLKVERSTYFLRTLDPDANFEENQAYYSSQEFSPNFVSDVLFDGQTTVSDMEYVVLNDEDDPETEDIDESKTVKNRYAPGIRVELDKDFFQQNILDKEDAPELLSQANFQDFFRGIHISMPNTDNFMLLLDFNNANITVDYTYKKVDLNGTADDTSDDTIEDVESEFVINLTNGASSTNNIVNTLISEDYPTHIADKMDLDIQTERIYLKGGAGSYAEINLFDTENGREIIEQIKENNWIINEANLVFYVDRSALDVAMVNSKNEPPRLFLYDMETNLPLYKPINEVNETNTPLGLYLNYDGLLQKNASGKGEKYKFRITEWLNDVIVRDDVNATLGLTTTASILVPQPPSQLNPVAEAPYLTNLILQKDNEEMIYPSRSIASPLSTVLYGTNVAPENMDKKLKLEIFYTETN